MQNVSGEGRYCVIEGGGVGGRSENYMSRAMTEVINHPYPPLPMNISNIISKKIFEFTIRSEVPFSIVLAYITLVTLLNKSQDGKNRIKGPAWQIILLFHNIILAVFSGWTFLGTGPATFNYFLKGFKTAGIPGLVHTFCDSSMSHWDSVMAGYTYLFYLSKFWEILDTLILIGKGKKASLLQEYHHAGAILTVWCGVRYESTAAWIFVVLNSFVHTIMYTYYGLSVMHIRVPGLLKRSLTKIQIGQFLLGGSLGVLNLMLRLPKEVGNKFEWEPLGKNNHQVAVDRLGLGFSQHACLHTPGQKLTVLGGVGYLIPLTALFVSFYIHSYQKKLLKKKISQNENIPQSVKDTNQTKQKNKTKNKIN